MARSHSEPDYQRLSKILANTSRESFQFQVTFNNRGRGGEGKEASPVHPPETDTRCRQKTLSSPSSSARLREWGGEALKSSSFQKKKKVTQVG